MLAEAFPRLAIRLRSTFPDAEIALKDDGLSVKFPTFPSWEVKVQATPVHDQFQIFESKIILRYECLQDVPEEDFFRLISAENLGLRGATIVCDEAGGRRGLAIRSTFVGQKGRTRDEAESLAIDVLSLLRFARLFDDRVVRSQVGDRFVYDIYYSQYLSRSIGRNRFINYARSIFQGSTERVFGQMSNMLKEDYKYNVASTRALTATVMPPNGSTPIIVRIPEEIPMITCSASLHVAAWESEKSFALVARLNTMIKTGHFEVNADGSLISYVTWKHLTNDLRYYSLDQMIASVHEARALLQTQLPNWEPMSAEMLKVRASSLDAYSRSAA